MLASRDRDVEPVPVEQEPDAPRHVAVGGGGHRHDGDRRLLPLELVDRADRHVVEAGVAQPRLDRADLAVVGRDDAEVALAQRPSRAGVVLVGGGPGAAEVVADEVDDDVRPPRASGCGCRGARPCTTWSPGSTPSSVRAAVTVLLGGAAVRRRRGVTPAR